MNENLVQLKEKLVQTWDTLRYSLHPLLHRMGMRCGHGYSYWDGEIHYIGKLCDCGKVHGGRPSGFKRVLPK